MKDFSETRPMRSFKLLLKSIRKHAFPCCKRKKASLTYLLRPTRPSLRLLRASLPKKEHEQPIMKPAIHNIINAPSLSRKKASLTDLLRPTRPSLRLLRASLPKKEPEHPIMKPAINNIIKAPSLSEVVEIRQERFHLDIDEYPLNQLQITGKENRKLLMKVTMMKLTPTKKFEDGLLENSNNDGHKNERVKKELLKYYKNRFSLFSLYDHGIEMDEEAWYSTTPEAIAEYLAKRIGCKVILDAFCGVGGNCIQFAKYGQFVIANDIDSKKISYARHNSRIYGVQQKIEFKNQDFLTLDIEAKVDYVFLAPPWGGISYTTDENYSLKKKVTPDICKIMDKAWTFSDKIILALPRNIHVEELLEILVESTENSSRKIDRAFVEIEKVFLNNKLSMILVYFGNSSKVQNSIEFNKIYEKILSEKTDKSQKGYNPTEKEMVKKIIEKIGMVKMLNLSEYFSKFKKQGDSRLSMLCEYLKKNNMISEDDI